MALCRAHTSDKAQQSLLIQSRLIQYQIKHITNICLYLRLYSLLDNSYLIHLIFIMIKIPENYSLRNVQKC